MHICSVINFPFNSSKPQTITNKTKPPAEPPAQNLLPLQPLQPHSPHPKYCNPSAAANPRRLPGRSFPGSARTRLIAKAHGAQALLRNYKVDRRPPFFSARVAGGRGGRGGLRRRRPPRIFNFLRGLSHVGSAPRRGHLHKRAAGFLVR